MHIIFKRFIAFFLSFNLVILGITPAFAVYDPNPKHSKWFHDSIVNDPLNKSSVDIKASKTYPVSTLDQNGKPIKGTRTAKSAIKLAPNANKVGKTLFKRTPMTAIGYAVTALLGKAVDWVLDPENNSVKYKEEQQEITYHDNQGSGKRGFITDVGQAGCSFRGYGSYKSDEDRGNSYQYVICTNGKGFLVKVSASDPVLVHKHIPIEKVASQVIDDAYSGQAPAMQVMTDTALDMLEAGELDSSLDSASDTPQPDPEYDPSGETGGETGGETDPDGNTDGQNPDPETNPEPTPTEWPKFCDWAFPVCDFIEWVKQEPQQEDTEIDIEEPDVQPTDTSFDFGGSCPAPFTFKGSMFGNPIEITLLDTDAFCSFLSTYVKWPVYAASSLFAIYIIGGRKDE